ncbi:MAG: glycosyltransferase, partial [Acetobacteraceae bacterium]|nr:glycosyltransferase [Acetobacteraceae bacterium]
MAVAGWAASPAGIERIEVGFASREVQARRMPVSPDLLAQLSKLVAADRVFGYLVVLDLAEVPPGERELTVRATAGDGQIAWRSGLVRVDPEERYMQWAAAHGQRRMSRRRTRRELRLRICTVPTASCDAVRLPESLECQRYRQWDVRALPEAAAQMHSDPAWMRLAGCADVAPGTLADLLRQAAEEADAVVLAAVSDRLHPDALAEFTTWLCASPTPDVIYCDEERLAEDGRATGVRLKPGWSPELLLQYDYIGSVVVLSRRGIRAALQVAGELGTAYEILLALADQSVLVERIPLALVARRPHEEPDSDAATDALQRLATRRGRELVIEADGAGGRQLRWPLHALPLVSLVIPTTGVRHLLEPCLRSLQLHTSYAPLQLILVDSGIGEAAAVADQALAGRQYEIVPYEEGGDRARFNFSHACNLGLAQARGEQVLFLNDDVEVVQADWLERMVECAGLPLTGAVGTRLVWPEGLVQHCGLALRGFGVGPPGNAYEVLAGHELSSAGPGRLLLHTHERAAVTGACLMAPRELLLRLGGWDCRFPLDFGDVDLCLRIWESGRRVLVMPSVSLRHRQSATREFVADHEGLSRFKRRWEPFFPA